MKAARLELGQDRIGLGAAAFWWVVSALAFLAAFRWPVMAAATLLFLYGLLQVTRLESSRWVFYGVLALGMVIYPPFLGFFWTVFGPAAVLLWLIMAFWLALFALLEQRVRLAFGERVALLAAPVLWLGVEYFRSELQYLRFSWLSLGYAFDTQPWVIGESRLGVYGVGFVLMGIVVALQYACHRSAAWILGVLMALMTGADLVGIRPRPFDVQNREPALSIAGVQYEFPIPEQVPSALDELLRLHPSAQLLVMSEYTFDGPVPDAVRAWCRRHERYLVVGGKEPLADGRFRNTAFVVGPDGEVVFTQAKSVPIQFFNDGLPATHRAVWESPWGKIGIGVCYDLSYREVIDDLVRQGAQALVIPVMDVVDWGPAQHALHGRVAPVRAAEYGVPVFRLCSSGISQVVDHHGRVLGTAPFPGVGEVLCGRLVLDRPGRLPLDHWLGPWAAGTTLGMVALLVLHRFTKGRWPAWVSRLRRSPQ